MNGSIAIIGSTGQNATAWTDAFIAAGLTVRNLVRFPEQLAHRPGRHSARLDLDDSSTFQPALKGIHTLGLITPSHPDQVKREVGLIYAAKQAGVRRIIKLSVIGADFVCPISAFARWHANVEDVLRTSDVAHVILRPNFFMQNTLLQKASIEAGIYAEPIATGSISLGLFSLLLTAAAPLAMAGRFSDSGWVATWTASPQASEPGLIPDLNNQTVRLIVHATVGGNQLRIRLSNAYGTQPLLIGDAHVAVSACALLPTIVAGTDQALTFGGQSTITIPVRAVILSDPVNFLGHTSDRLSRQPLPAERHPKRDANRTLLLIAGLLYFADRRLCRVERIPGHPAVLFVVPAFKCRRYTGVPNIYCGRVG
jgi:uncharacterized protein YbjT (DUF2867 family)